MRSEEFRGASAEYNAKCEVSCQVPGFRVQVPVSGLTPIIDKVIATRSLIIPVCVANRDGDQKLRFWWWVVLLLFIFGWIE